MPVLDVQNHDVVTRHPAGKFTVLDVQNRDLPVIFVVTQIINEIKNVK